MTLYLIGELLIKLGSLVCSYAGCILPLGQSKTCQLCQDHAVWCKSKLEPVPRVFLRPPYEISFEVAVSKFLYDWDPVQVTALPSHINFLQSIFSNVDLQTTLKNLSIPDWLITYVQNIISVGRSEVIYQMVPYWPWKDTKLHKLYSDGDGNHAYLIPDANPANHFALLSIFMVMIQALFSAQIS